MTFTTGQLVTIVVGAAAFILSLLNIWDRSHIINERLNKPQKDLEERVAKAEHDIEDIKRWLDNDKRSIDELKASNNMSMKVQFALLNHSIHKDNEDELKHVQAEMQQFLASRGIT